MTDTTPAHDYLRQTADVLTTPLPVACLHALIFLNLVQLAAGLAGVDPQPPAQVLPMIAATAAIGLIALHLLRHARPLGLIIGSAFCLISMIGMGPHKLFLQDGLVIAPVALVGFAAEVTFLWLALRHLTGAHRS